jgi:phthalate 4,5-dioxygenase oxygenase subunit
MVPARVEGAEATDSLWLRPSTDKAPRMQVERTDYGFRYAALRRPIKDAATKVYARCTVFVAPYTVLIPPNNLYNVANVNIPMDDVTMAFYFIAWGHPSQTPETATWRKFLGNEVGVDLDRQYRPLRNVENRYWQDRQAMKAGNFTGIRGIPNQDSAMWVTMGPIADRSRDRLGASDVAIVEFRRRMLDALAQLESDGVAIGTDAQRVPEQVCSFQSVMPKEQDWRAYPARYVWDRVAQGDAELDQAYAVGDAR